jgi:hypothetical protein
MVKPLSMWRVRAVTGSFGVIATIGARLLIPRFKIPCFALRGLAVMVLN